MDSPFLSRVVLLLFFGLLSSLLDRSAAAQSEEEMAVLQMFYKEKDLVVSPTRHAKPITQAAENITVITAKEIERMNAHTVAEILDRIPGLFIVSNRDFGASSLVQTQGSEERHSLVMVDGVPWNFLNSGHAETNSIPVGIIERIEVIKGPASSTWGSSLGGVVNIITKGVGSTDKPTGSLRASAGERSSQDHRAELSGKAGPAGYYFYGGYQHSDGLRPSRGFDNYSLYSRAEMPLAEKTRGGVSLGYSEPDIDLGEFPSGDLLSKGKELTFFATAFLNTALNKDLSLHLSFHHFKQRYSGENNVLGLGMFGTAGEQYLNTRYDEKTNGGDIKLIWTKEKHTAVFGLDYDHGVLAQTLETGTFLQSWGVPAKSCSHPDRTWWALYANDTVVLGRWSITPGIRYDHNDITGSFVSPSLGATYRVSDHSLLRASVARGFTVPPLAWTSGGGLFLDPNPSLDSETIWSYQIGAEMSILNSLWIKATLFHHEVEDTLQRATFAGGPPAYNDLIVNGRDTRRQGIEFEIESLPLWNFSIVAGVSYVHVSPATYSGSKNLQKYTFGVRYDDRHSVSAELFGHYLWWDLPSEARARYDDTLWDFNVAKNLYTRGDTSSELFFTAHNLFNGAHYTYVDSKNPRRWLEGGLRIKF